MPPGQPKQQPVGHLPKHLPKTAVMSCPEIIIYRLSTHSASYGHRTIITWIEPAKTRLHLQISTSGDQKKRHRRTTKALQLRQLTVAGQLTREVEGFSATHSEASSVSWGPSEIGRNGIETGAQLCPHMARPGRVWGLCTKGASIASSLCKEEFYRILHSQF